MTDNLDLISEFYNIHAGFMVSHGIKPADITFSHARGTGGCIKYGVDRHHITISANMSQEEMKITLLHEIAHSICWTRYGRNEGHSYRFWSLATRLGVNRKHAPITTVVVLKRANRLRTLYVCESCKTTITVLRRLKDYKRSRHIPCRNSGLSGKLSYFGRER